MASAPDHSSIAPVVPLLIAAAGILRRLRRDLVWQVLTPKVSLTALAMLKVQCL
jgi:hypothetical protein